MGIRKWICFVLLVAVVCAGCLSVSSAEDTAFSVGDTIIFGNYQSTPIEWQVLDIKDDNALVISSKILCELPYNTVTSKFITWENCTLRRWLNNDFLSAAFTPDESALIQTTHVDNSSAQTRDTTVESQPDTEDKVFLLSWKEACDYFPDDESRICQRTSWWTRSRGELPSGALSVARDGGMHYGGGAPENGEGIRPVMWVSLHDPDLFAISDTVPEYVDQSDDFEYQIRGGQAVITKYKGAGGTVFIPPTLGGKAVKTIPRLLFSGSVEQEFGPIRSVVIPEGVTKIDSSAFYDCDLERIYIPASVTSIGDTVFSYCEKLETILVDPENKKFSVADGVLFTKSMDTLIIYPAGKSDTSYTVPEGVKNIGGGAFSDCVLETVILPEGVKSIGRTSFWGCQKLKTLYIPSTLSKINDSAFGYNYKMESFEVAEGNRWFAVEGGVLYSKKFDTLIMYPNNKPDKSFIMPDTVKKIEKRAFNDTYNLEEITISKMITKIDDSLFYACRDLKKVVLHDKVKEIGNAAFGYARDMHIFIPESVKKISENAFFECKNITIEGKPGSYAEKYAAEYGIQFVAAD